VIRMRAKDRIGQVINGFKILSVDGIRGGRRTFVTECSYCGKIIVQSIESMKHFKRGEVSCGHRVNWPHEQLSKTFQGMCARCYNKNTAEYNRYGGRGIHIDTDWLRDPQVFVEWCLDNNWEPGLTIDRIDNDGDYCPDNCQWITRSENCAKTSRTSEIWVGIEGHSWTGWAEVLGLPKSYFLYRKKRYGYDAAYNKLMSIVEGR
jgi:hypothetical protein